MRIAEWPAAHSVLMIHELDGNRTRKRLPTIAAILMDHELPGGILSLKQLHIGRGLLRWTRDFFHFDSATLTVVETASSCGKLGIP
jgi:hypothetical protein